MKYMLCFSLCWYEDANWGWRWLGHNRRSLDLGRVSFRFEFLDYE